MKIILRKGNNSNTELNQHAELNFLGELIFGYIKENIPLYGVVQLNISQAERKRLNGE